MGRFTEAAEAAAKVLTIDPGHQKAHYVLATARVRMGQKEIGEKELELYQKLEAKARAETDRGRDIIVLNHGAAAKVLEGRAEEGIEMFLRIIETYPDSSAAYLNLSAVQSRLGRHDAAVATLQKMVSRGMDSFLVYWNLAQEYRSLGDMEASRRAEVVYLQDIDLGLRKALVADLD
jgi:tetratricopeptide (TPR) repeat protein